MKKFKKIMAVLVAAIMVVAMTVPAFAADTDSGRLGTKKAKITIANPKDGETYSLYRLFELASFDDNNTATGQHYTDQGAVDEWYSYVIKETSGATASWWKFLTTYGPNGAISTGDVPYAVSDDSDDTTKAAAYFVYSKEKVNVNGEPAYHIIKGTDKFINTVSNKLDDTASANTRENNNGGGDSAGPDYVDIATKNKIVQDFAQEALKYATANHATLKIIDSVTSNGTANLVLINNDSASNYPLGYYLIGSSMGTLAALDTTNSAVTVNEKNDEPKIEKYVKDKDGAWKKNTNANIDDYVQFQIIITAEQGAKNYEVHDVMEKGLTFVDAAGHALSVSLKRTISPVAPATEPTVKTYSIEAAPTNVSIEGEDGTNTRTNYTLTKVDSANAYLTDGCDFEILFNDANGLNGAGAATGYGDDKVTFLVKPEGKDKYEYIDIKDGDQIIIEYYAKLDSDATIYGTNETALGTSTQIKDTVNAKLDDSFQVDKDYNESDTSGIQRNDNYTILTYGNKSHTTREKASVTTYQFDVVKTKDVATSNKYDLLATAKFSLYRVKELAANSTDTEDWTVDGKKYKKDLANALVFTIDGNSYKYAGDTATTGAAAGIAANQTLTSVNDAAMNVNGLIDGTYILEENEAPLGYDKLAHPFVITITGHTDNTNIDTPQTTEGQIKRVTVHNNGTSESDDSTVPWKATVNGTQYDKTTDGGVQVINTTGTELPSTGGMGTTVLYIVGGMLVILAGAYLFFSRKRTA